MPSKSRVVADQRKTEEIIQSYGHEVTPETLALFNGVLPERIIQTPSYDTGAQAARIEPRAEAKMGEQLVSSPIDGLAPADISKSRDSKPGGLNTVETKHEASVVELAAQSVPPDPEGGVDAGTFISPDLPPVDIGAKTARAPMTEEERKAQEDKAKAQAKAEADRRKAQEQAQAKK